MRALGAGERLPPRGFCRFRARLPSPSRYGKFVNGRGLSLPRTIPAGLDRKEAAIFLQLDPARLPRHIAIIMDGNGRWARRRHMPRVAGHRAGAESVRSTLQTASRI